MSQPETETAPLEFGDGSVVGEGRRLWSKVRQTATSATIWSTNTRGETSMSERSGKVLDVFPRIVPPAPIFKRRFIALSKWEGAVLERFDTYFTAEVIDLKSEERAMADFDLRDLADSDVPLCEPGALFYWSIGYEIKESGQRSRVSMVRFRRLGISGGR